MPDRDVSQGASIEAFDEIPHWFIERQPTLCGELHSHHGDDRLGDGRDQVTAIGQLRCLAEGRMLVRSRSCGCESESHRWTGSSSSCQVRELQGRIPGDVVQVLGQIRGWKHPQSVAFAKLAATHIDRSLSPSGPSDASGLRTA